VASTAFGLADPERQFAGGFVTFHPDSNAYSCVAVGGLMTGAAAGDPFFSFRTGTSGIYVIQGLRLFITQVTKFDFVRVNWADCYHARSFTASDSGGIAPTITGNNCKGRTSDVTTGIADLRIADTSALTVGTRTLSTNPDHTGSALAAGGVANANITNGFSIVSPPDSNAVMAANANIVMAANEGLILQWRFAFPSTGTWQPVVSIHWQELPSL